MKPVFESEILLARSFTDAEGTHVLPYVLRAYQVDMTCVSISVSSSMNLRRFFKS